jgi:NADPH:quinone reductase-like Zn-dependent oxidoreductase
MSEKVVLNAATAYELPAERSFAEGAALILTYGTSIHALLDRGHIKEGDTLLILGAAGGVGLAAIELGVAFGARVIAAVSSEEKAKVAREAGASDVVIYGRAPFDKDQSKALSEAFKKAVGPNGADIIYDAVGGDYADPAIRSIAWEGRYLVVGFPSGIPKLPLNLTLLKSCDVCGVFWGAFTMRDPEKNRDHIARLFRLWKDGKINPRVTDIFPLAKGGDAIAKMARREAIGKLVVTND